MKIQRVIKFVSILICSLVIFTILVLATFRVMAYIREVKTIEELSPEGGQLVQTSLGSVHLQIQGPKNKIPILLVHGTAAWSGFWRDVMDMLVSNGFQVIAADLPPFGFSEPSLKAQYKHKDQAIRIHEALNRLGFDKVILVGHSFGSGPVVETTLKFPEQVAGLVLVSSALGLPDDGVYPLELDPVVNWLLRTRIVSEAIISSFVTNSLFTKQTLASMLYNKDAADSKQVNILQIPMSRSGSTEAYAKWLPVFLNYDSSALCTRPENYSSIKIPVSIIWGDKDKITPLAKAEQLKELLPQATLTLLTDVGHLPHIEDKKFKEVLLKELTRITTKIDVDK